MLNYPGPLMPFWLENLCSCEVYARLSNSKFERNMCSGMLQQMDGWEIYLWIYQYTIHFHNLPYVQVSIKTYLVLKKNTFWILCSEVHQTGQRCQRRTTMKNLRDWKNDIIRTRSWTHGLNFFFCSKQLVEGFVCGKNECQYTIHLVPSDESNKILLPFRFHSQSQIEKKNW